MTEPRSVPMVDRVTDAFFALDADWRFTYLNDRAETLLERSRTRLIGRVLWDEFPETVETQFPEGFYRAMDEGTAVSFDVYHAHLETWLEARAYPAAGGLSVYVCDATERRERTTQLARHAAVVEAITDGVVTLDGNSRIVSVNRALERALDVDREALLGAHVETLLDRASIDADRAVSIGRAITDVETGNAVRRKLEVPYVDASGDERVGELRIVPVDHGSATVACIAGDVTDRREYERVVDSLHEITRWLLQSTDREEICATAVHAGSDLLDLPISGVWLLDDERGYLDPVAGTADAHDEFGGLPRFDSGEGLVWDVFEDGEPARYDDLHDIDGVYNPETPIRSEIIAPIGTHGVLMTGAFEPHQFDETDLDLVSTLVENTCAALDRADRERVLGRRTDELERQTERLEAVATVLSEDLTDHLEAVTDAIEADGSVAGGGNGTDGTDDGGWEFPLAEDGVTTTLERAEHLVDDVREFARNATAVGTRSRIDLETAIDAAATASRLESAAVVEDRAALRADPDRFAHLLETVLDDAAERSDGDVAVRVGLLGVEKSAGGPRGFYLHDDGFEIPPTSREDAFDPSSDDRATDGLGLAVARAIAEAHDWTVAISNGDDGGTRFEVREVTTLEREGS